MTRSVGKERNQNERTQMATTTVDLNTTAPGPAIDENRAFVSQKKTNQQGEFAPPPPLNPALTENSNSKVAHVVADFRATYTNTIVPFAPGAGTNRFDLDADPALYSQVFPLAESEITYEWVAVENCVPYDILYDPVTPPLVTNPDPMNGQTASVMNIPGQPFDPSDPGSPNMTSGPVTIGLRVKCGVSGQSAYRVYKFASTGALLDGPAGNVVPPTPRWRAVRRSRKTFGFRNNSTAGDNPIAEYTIDYGDGQFFTYTGPNPESTDATTTRTTACTRSA